MKISYDHQIFSDQAYGGISRYFCEIVGRIGTYSGCEVSVLAPLHINEFASGLKRGFVGIRVPRIPRTGWIRRNVNAAVARTLFQRDPPDVVHETYYSAHTVAPKRSRIVVTVHDMIYEKLPDMVAPHDPTSRLKSIAIARADHIICVSERTKKDLMDVLSVSDGKVSVIYHGCSILAPNGHGPAAQHGEICSPFLLYVGVRSWYKNFGGLLRAYASSMLLRDDFDLLCYGGAPFSARERTLIRQLGLTGKVHRVVGDDDTLRELYSSARCLVYPSFYEGFGMPVIEAMACGCPVVCSRTSCLPEVAGCAAEYFDPSSCESIRASVEGVVYSEARCRSLVRHGKMQAAGYSWGQCAQQTLRVYSSLL